MGDVIDANAIFKIIVAHFATTTSNKTSSATSVSSYKSYSTSTRTKISILSTYTVSLASDIDVEFTKAAMWRVLGWV